MLRTGRKKQFRVPLAARGQRLDSFLTEKLKIYSRSRIKHLIQEGMATVNGRRKKAHYRLQDAEQIEVALPRPEEDLPAAQPFPLDIIYEDSEIIVLNKPAGLLVHPLRAGQGGTLLNALLSHTRRLSSAGGVLRQGIVHRLDKDTSGLMVVAKSDFSHRNLSRQFKERTLEKEYRALVWGHPPGKQGELNYPLGRSRRQRTKMTVKYIGGREARTLYEVLKRFRDCSYLRLLLKTGRTHQIRVHLSQLGCPVLGDRKYGRCGKERAESIGIARQMLHACRLKFTHPVTGQTVRFAAPLPDDMKRAMIRLRNIEKT